jgi:hypothetical protein
MGTEGGHPLAFALSPDEFKASFARIRSAGVAYVDTYHDAANMRGPGSESGARGLGEAVYLFDPSGHPLEIRRY